MLMLVIVDEKEIVADIVNAVQEGIPISVANIERRKLGLVRLDEVLRHRLGIVARIREQLPVLVLDVLFYLENLLLDLADVLERAGVVAAAAVRQAWRAKRCKARIARLSVFASSKALAHDEHQLLKVAEIRGRVLVEQAILKERFFEASRRKRRVSLDARARLYELGGTSVAHALVLHVGVRDDIVCLRNHLWNLVEVVKDFRVDHFVAQHSALVQVHVQAAELMPRPTDRPVDVVPAWPLRHVCRDFETLARPAEQLRKRDARIAPFVAQLTNERDESIRGWAFARLHKGERLSALEIGKRPKSVGIATLFAE